MALRSLIWVGIFWIFFGYGSPAGAGRVPFSHSRFKLLEMQKRISTLNKPFVKSIRSPDGDILDCVLLQNQPAFDHPTLKDHKLQMQPSFWPDKSKQEVGSGDGKNTVQRWHENGRCPGGTIPIRRTTIDDILRVGSIRKYGRKAYNPPIPKNFSKPEIFDTNGHEHAIAYLTGGEYYGAQASMNVWRPSIDMPSEFSLSQIWLLAGSFLGDLNSIEAGWQVSPELYGDSNPRLFTYWTSDAYQATGCYNLLCSGFIQTTSEIAIGASISPLSIFNGPQYDIKVLIWKDPRTSNWWMRVGDKFLVGYWPAELFTHLADHASMIEFGGEIVNTQPFGIHTSTQMGSGHFPPQGFGEASYFRNLGFVDSDNELHTQIDLQILAEHPNCYNIMKSVNPDWGQYFFYGGPGQNPSCP